MRSPPAFQFYAGDWLSSTHVALMTPAQEGAYIRLLCHAWNNPDCCLPDDDATLAALSRLGEEWLKGSSTVVRQCFVPHPKMPGFLVNERLLEERKKQASWRTKCRKGAAKTAAIRRSRNSGSTPLAHAVDSLNGCSSVFNLQSSSSELTNNAPAARSKDFLSRFKTLFDNAEFLAAWDSWKQHRSEIRKPLTRTAISQQLIKFSRWGPERSAAAIRFSVAQGYTGIYEENSSHGQHRTDPAQRQAAHINPRLQDDIDRLRARGVQALPAQSDLDFARQSGEQAGLDARAAQPESGDRQCIAV